MRAVKRDGFSLQYASKELQGDKEVVLMALNEKLLATVQESKRVFQYASEELRSDRDVVRGAMQLDNFYEW